MRLGFVLIAVFCGVCFAVPTEVASASAVATTKTEASAGGANTTETASAGSTVLEGEDTPAFPAEGDFEDESDEESAAFGLPLASALLFSSQHGHHVCLPDVLAYSLLGNLQGYPFGSFFPSQHTSSQRLQQELSFLKAFTKAGQQVWKAIATGHGKAVHHAMGNFEKVTSKVESVTGETVEQGVR